MKALLFVEDPWLRDQLRAGMSICPELEVEWGFGRQARQMLAEAAQPAAARYAWIWLQIPSVNAVAAIEKIREVDRETPLVLLGDEKEGKTLLTQKEIWKIDGFLNLPLDAEDFFRTLGRLRARALATRPRSSSPTPQ